MSTIESYDEVPYESYAITESHPDRLRVIGRLFGLDTAPADRCRVLELGAAAGGNLIPMAFNLPQSRFIGVELSAVQARRGQTMIAELGLANARMLQRDILELSADPEADLGSFDYIIVHGVWSWAPRPVREHILVLCAGLLAPGGIAYLSYNVAPGWHQRAMLRDMLLHVTADADPPAARLARARELLDRLVVGLPADGRPEAQVLLREVRYLQGARDSYLFHEYLEAVNEPELFSDFIARARSAGLQYLADADLYTMFPDALGEAGAAVLDTLQTLSETEQMFDFLSLRPFRRSLLVRAGERIQREIDLERLFSLRPYADLSPDEEPVLDDRPQVYRASGGAGFRVAHPLTKAVLADLARVYPSAAGVADLLESARHEVGAGNTLDADASRQALAELFNLFCSGGVGFTGLGSVWPNRPGTRPRATSLARVQARAGEGHAASVRHREVTFDRLSEHLLSLLDGTRDIDALAAAALSAIDVDPDLAGPLAERVQDEGTRDSVIRAGIERLLGIFAHNGLLDS